MSATVVPPSNLPVLRTSVFGTATPPAGSYHQNPWELLHQELPHVRVTFRWLRPGLMGYTERPKDGPPHIVIGEGIGAAETRVTVAHEAHHVFRGPPSESAIGKADDELVVRALTAKWLLPDAELVGRVMRRHGLEKAAAKLHVTVDVLLDWVQWADQESLDQVSTV